MRTLLLALLCVTSTASLGFTDPLVDEIARWKKFAETNQSNSENWQGIRDSALPLARRAEVAVQKGHRYLALHILAALQTNLAAQQYIQQHDVSAETSQQALEQEWRKTAGRLKTPQTPNLENVPLAARAIAEVSFSEVPVYYEASLDYGKNTMPEYGFFYLGLATGQLAFSEFISKLPSEQSLKAPAFPGLKQQIDLVEDTILAAYNPPASIEQHPRFIRASALVKQARELYAEGKYSGALYRTLYAQQVLSAIANPGKTMTSEEAESRIAEILAKVEKDHTDHTLVALYVELVQEEPFNGENARVVLEDVLPIYFAALQAPEKQERQPEPVATVTLVRWPYT